MKPNILLTGGLGYVGGRVARHLAASSQYVLKLGARRDTPTPVWLKEGAVVRMDVLDEGNKVVFLHRVVPGGADRSYGIEVARLAGLPRPVIERAHAAGVEQIIVVGGAGDMSSNDEAVALAASLGFEGVEVSLASCR